MTPSRPHAPAIVLLAALGAAACADDGARRPDAGDPDVQASVQAVLDRAVPRIVAAMDSVDDALQPVPLLRPAERSALRRYLNEEQLSRARRLGVAPPLDAARVRSLEDEGRLVTIPDTTEGWVVRKLDHSLPLVTPDALALLEEVARRFRAGLDSLGVPPVRLEVTSALRTEESQADLRRGNVNATGGRSTHEYGTTLDVAYSGFTAPAEPVVAFDADEAPWLEPALTRMAAGAVETVAARRSRELQAILGRVLARMQEEGKVMVTLEEQQPVYHMTVARALAGSGS